MPGKIQNEDIKSSSELVSLGGTAAQLPNDDKVYVTALGINKTLKQAIIDGDISGGGGTCEKESITLSGTDITNGYVALSFQSSSNSIDLHVDRLKMFESRDYTTSIVSLVTRITFAGTFVSSGNDALVAGDVLYVEYIQA